MNSRVKWENAVSTQSQKVTLLFCWTLWDMIVISYIGWHLKLLPPFKCFTAKCLHILKNIWKICQFYRPPFPTIAIFFNVVSTILLKVSFVCFWDAAHHNNDDKIKILDALIWESQDLSDSPRSLNRNKFFWPIPPYDYDLQSCTYPLWHPAHVPVQWSAIRLSWSMRWTVSCVATQTLLSSLTLPLK